jgi:competence protein ComGC
MKNNKKQKNDNEMKLNIKKNNFKPFILLIVISLLIAFLVPYLYKGQFNIDKKVSLDTFVKTYNS